jgi:hypothetical protein
MYKNLNINPLHRRADDCTVRAIAKVLGERWEDVYTDLCLEGLRFYDMPSANHVWGSYLKKRGFTKHIIPDTCPQCYTVAEFAEDNPHGSYILALSGHVVAIIDGDWYDSFNSGDRIPVYYWKKGD